MQEKSYTSLWLGSIMVLMQRTLDWGNSLKISLSSLCIEVKRVRKKSRPRNRQDDVFEQFQQPSMLIILMRPKSVHFLGPFGLTAQ